MKQKFTFDRWVKTRRYVVLSLLMCLVHVGVYAQIPASSYGFTAVSGTYTEITGGTAVTVIQADDGISGNLPLGFTFSFCGVDYTQFKVTSNGIISLGTGTSSNTWTNGTGNIPAVKPVLMALWDDLAGWGAGAAASYLTTGTAPNRTFTMQWKNWNWRGTTGGAAHISFQVKLYETTNVIEYIYRQEAAAVTSDGATIGIADAAATATYLSLNNATATPVASSTVFTTNITTKPATNQVYRFTPPPPCSTTTAPAVAAATASPTTICLSGTVNLGISVPMPAALGFTYQWQRAAVAAGPYTTVAVTTTNTYAATVTASSFFRCRVLCNNDSATAYWTSSASPQVIINNPGVPTVTGAARCGPGTVTLSATPPAGSTINWYQNATGGAPLATGTNTFNTGYLPATTTFYAAAASGASPANGWIGTGTNVTGSPSPYYTLFWGHKLQTLVTAAEMIAAGFGAGTVNSIGYDVVANGGLPLNNFEIKMGTTNATALTAFQTTGMNTVYTVPVYNPVANAVNVHTLTTPFIWDGSSNIIIETCFNNSSWSTGHTVKYSTTTFNSSVYAQSDVAGFCPNPSAPTTTTNRPNIRFDMTLGCTGVRQPVVATINPSPVVGKTFTPVVCNNASTNILLTPPTPAYPNYTWTPVTDLYTDAAGTIPYLAGSSATSVYMKTSAAGNHTYYMMAGNPAATTGCTYADTVRIYVQPGNVAINGLPDTICSSGSTMLSLNPISGYSAGTIQWQSSTNGTTYTNITGATNPTYTTGTLTFGNNTYYKAVITAGAATCQEIVKYVVVANPTVINAPDSFNCGAGQVVLNAATGGNSVANWYDAATGGNLVYTGNTFTTPYLAATTPYYLAASGGLASSAAVTTIGLGATASTDASSPFYHVWGGYKNQYLITKAELNAAGIFGGPLTGLSFNLTSGAVAHTGFSIAMKNTTATGLTTTYETGLTEVRAPANYTTVNGWNTFAFASPFYWNGNDNIVVQTCWSNNNGGGTSNAARIDNTTYTSTHAGYGDNQPVAALCAAPPNHLTYNKRPQMRFNYFGPCESSPRQEVIAYIHPKPVVDLGANINRCIDLGELEVLDAGVQPNAPQYLWDNGSFSQVRAVGTSGNYHVTVTNQFTCVGSDTINVTLRKNPVVELGNDTTVCNGVVLNLNAGSDGIGYFWNTGAVSQTINVNAAGSYNVFVTNEEACVKADTIVINMQGELPLIQGINITNNGQYSFHFTAINPQNVVGYDWDFGDGSPHSYSVSPQHTYTNAGNYIVVLRLSSTCGFLDDSTSAHIVGVNQIHVDDKELSVYPNPTRDQATILVKGSLKMEKVEVYNIIGQRVYKAETDASDKHTLQLGNLASGVYTIQVFTDKGTVARKLEILR